MDLKQIRLEIDQIDQEMAHLFEKRMDLSKQVGEYKMKYGLPINDKVREEKVIEKNLKLISNEDIKGYYVDYLHSVMDISKRYQTYLTKGMKIAYCGVEGAFSYIASKKLFENGQLISYPNFTSAYKAVETCECDACVLPLENSTAGDVGSVMDLLFSGSLFINDIVNIDIVHNLIANHDTKKEDIKTVVSHPQALAQCQKYIEANHYAKSECSNTAIAAKELSLNPDPSKAVIASKDVASLYNLKILENDINESRNNSTRFAVFTKSLNSQNRGVKMGEHFILVFTVLNEAGALAKTLNIIGAHGFNMRTLRSRPLKELQWNYYFFVELDGDINSNDGKDMINELKGVCDCLNVVGCYYSHIER